MFINWDSIYNYFGIRDFIYFISSPSIQDTLFPVKIAFIFFAIFFFCAMVWFYRNSSYLQYKFLQDMSEFLSKESYGLKQISKSWKKIKQRAESGSEANLKLAVIEADDFLYETLQDNDYEGENFEEILSNANTKKALDYQAILDAHQVRNLIVHEGDYKLSFEEGKKILSVYESAVKTVAVA